MKIEHLIGVHLDENGRRSKISLNGCNFGQICLQSRSLFMQPADICVDC